MNQLIVPCGYMGSGSSAITDLMKEIKNYKAPNNDFEYVFLHCPNGVFDLEDKLLNGNNAIRSDEAIHSFIATMRLLFDKKNYWVGMYKSKVSVDFMKYCYDFIEKLNVYKYNNTYWYYQQIPDLRMSIQNYFRRMIAKLRFLQGAIKYGIQSMQGALFIWPQYQIKKDALTQPALERITCQKEPYRIKRYRF